MGDLAGAGVLIQAEEGWFLARAANGAATVEPVGKADTGHVSGMYDLAGAGVLIGAEKGLFLARAVDGAATVEPAGKADTGHVFNTRDLAGAGVLIHAEKGLFLARAVNGGATVEPASKANTGYVLNIYSLAGAGVLIRADDGWFLASWTPLLNAKVELRDRETLDRSAPRPDSDLDFVFTVAHACASAADKLDLRLTVARPGRRPIEPKFKPQSVDNGEVAEVALPLRINEAGTWSFQLMSTLGGTERPVGEPQHLTFRSEGLRAWFENGLRGWPVVLSSC
jgi:hypothetical protein